MRRSRLRTISMSSSGDSPSALRYAQAVPVSSSAAVVGNREISQCRKSRRDHKSSPSSYVVASNFRTVPSYQSEHRHYGVNFRNNRSCHGDAYSLRSAMIGSRASHAAPVQDKPRIPYGQRGRRPRRRVAGSVACTWKSWTITSVQRRMRRPRRSQSRLRPATRHSENESQYVAALRAQSDADADLLRRLIHRVKPVRHKFRSSPAPARAPRRPHQQHAEAPLRERFSTRRVRCSNRIDRADSESRPRTRRGRLESVCRVPHVRTAKQQRVVYALRFRLIDRSRALGFQL